MIDVVEAATAKKAADENVKLSKVFKTLSSNIEKNNELLNRLLELTLESESDKGLAPLHSVLSRGIHVQRDDKVISKNIWSQYLLVMVYSK